MLNNVQLIGNLGQDPETRYTQDGKAVCNLSIATSERWKDKQGQQQEMTEWHRVVFFERAAELAAEYLHKGSKVYISGSLRTRKWQDKQGNDRYTTEVRGRDLKFLDSKGEATTQPPLPPKKQPMPAAEPDFNEDDIPF